MMLRMFVSISIFGLLAASATGCAATHEPEPSTSEGEDAFTSVPDCKGFDLAAVIQRTHDLSPDYQCQVSSALSRSSQPSEGWIRSLANPTIRETPFRAVVNLRGENGSNGEEPTVRNAGMKPLNIKVRDMHAPARDQVLQFLAFVTSPENRPALVHCKAGQGRTGTFVAAYRMAVQGWAPADAIAEARTFNVNDEQAAFLQDFATHLGDDDVKRFRPAP
jgi:protein-tyrosine phosphatase